MLGRVVVLCAVTNFMLIRVCSLFIQGEKETMTSYIDYLKRDAKIWQPTCEMKERNE